MKRISYILRDLFRFKGATFTKIVSLTIGLTVGILAFGYCVFETDYDSFHRHGDRIYRMSSVGKNSEDYKIPFALLKESGREIPEVEMSTCISRRIIPRYKYKEHTFGGGDALRADTSFFRMFSYQMLAGDYHDLQYKDRVLFSDKFARIVFGEEEPVGKEIEFEGKPVTVAGVFKVFPRNSHLINITAIHSIAEVADESWTSEADFLGYIRLAPGTDPDAVARKIQAIAGRNLPEIKCATYELHPLRDLHLKYGWGYSTLFLVGGLGFILVLISTLNYVLIAISSLVQKTKEIGIHKINGASTGNIFTMFFTETVFLIVISGILASGLLLAFKPFFEYIMFNEYASLFNTRVWIAVGLFFILMILLNGAVPARLFATVPVLQIFRQVAQGRRSWKYILLWVQFFSACLLLTVLIIFSGQYRLIMNKDLGYNMENLCYIRVVCGSPYPSLASVKAEAERFPIVRHATFADNLPLWANSATVFDAEGQGMFRSCVLSVDEDFFSTLEIPVLEGDSLAFAGGKDRIWVNEKFRDRLDVAGKTETGISLESAPVRLCGTCRDFQVLSLYALQQPLVLTRLQEPDTSRLFYLIIKLQGYTREQGGELLAKLREISGQSDLGLYDYQATFRVGYDDHKDMCTTVQIFSWLAVLIAVLGIFGFAGDEVNRRTKEIAIRKVNGASVGSITLLLLRNICLLALFAIPFALAGAYFIGGMWLEEFAYRLPLGIGIFLGGASGTLALILSTVLLRSRQAIRARPAEALKSE